MNQERILIISDADTPQVNGVVRSTHTIISALKKKGKNILLVSPQKFNHKWCISKQDRVEIVSKKEYKNFQNIIKQFSPNAIHIMTEGPLGILGRKYCQKNNIPFTTSFHTLWPEYLWMRYKLPPFIPFRFLQWFHKPSKKIFVPSPQIIDKYRSKKISEKMIVVPNSIEKSLFSCNKKNTIKKEFKRPIHLFVGRVCPEKNLKSFLSLPLKGTKIIIGDGVSKTKLQKKYPNDYFLGEKFGKELSEYYSMADVFVFPSLTDTFGITLLESLSCGTPVATYITPGSKFIKQSGAKGVFDNNCLKTSIHQALDFSKQHDNSDLLGKAFSLDQIGEVFYKNLYHTNS